MPTPSRSTERDPLAAQVGARLRSLRLRRRLSQFQLGIRASVSRRQIIWYEGGHHLPSLRTAIALARELGVKLSELVGD